MLRLISTDNPPFLDLKSLVWDVDSEKILEILPFIGSSLQRLHVYDVLPVSCQVFGRLSSVCSQLKELDISGPINVESGVLSFCNMLEAPTDLRRVRINFYTPFNNIRARVLSTSDLGPLISLAQHIRLEDVYFKCDTPGLLRSWNPSIKNPFPSLRKLAVAGPSSVLPDLLRSAAPSSRLILFQSDGRPEMTGDTLHACALHTKLEHLKIRETEDNYQALPRGILKCLRSCMHLRHLDLNFLRPFSLTEDDLSVFISNLPHLVYLEIKARDGVTLTLRALAIVTESCPDIETISLYLDVTQGLDTPINSQAMLLRHIDPQAGRMIDAEGVTAFLRRLSAAQNLSVAGTSSKGAPPS